MTTLRRTITAAAVLVLALPTAAHADVSDHVVRAETKALGVSLFPDAVGSPLLTAGGTSAIVQEGPTATGSVLPLSIADQAVLGEAASAESSGDAVTAPEDGGDGCLLSPDVSGLTLDAICATAAADASDALLEQQASAELLLGGIDVDGTLLADVLTGGLGDAVEAIVVDLQDTAAGAVVTSLTEGCDTVLTGLNDSDLPATVNDLLAMAPDEVEPIADELRVDAPVCTDLLDFDVENLASPVVDLTPITEALAGKDLVSLTFDDVSSTVAGADGKLTGTGTQVLVTVTGPSLDFLNDLLVGVVTAVYDSTLDRIATELGQEVPAELDLPAQLQAGLDELPVFGGDEPLISATIDGGEATASLDDDAVATAGGSVPSVTIALSPTLLKLFGQDGEPTVVEGGQTEVIAAGTPLESTISVGDLVTDEDAVDGETELSGATARASATTVSLLTDNEGGITISLAESNAGAFGVAVEGKVETPDEPAPAPQTPETLPRTGGGAGLAALLALGGAVALRRRRDG